MATRDIIRIFAGRRNEIDGDRAAAILGNGSTGVMGRW